MSQVKKKRLFVLSLDGMPCSFVKQAVDSGLMPHLARLLAECDFRQMDSVLPPVSSSAWASFLTGMTPAQHGVMGFVHRDPATMDWFVPRGDALKGETLLKKLSDQGKTVFSMNVPMTCPPTPVNGVVIAGFLADDLNHATYPGQIGTLLKARGYRIDADTELAKKDLTAFVRELHDVLDKRVETMWHFWAQQNWDFFMAHIMETDRLYHFFWELFQQRHPLYASLFEEFHRKIDRLIGEIAARVEQDIALLLLSDHGFTTLKEEVNVNHWLYRQGLLRFNRMPPQSLKDLHPDTKAYALYPGRIFINLQGRERTGSIAPGTPYEELRAYLRRALPEIKNSAGQSVIKQVLNIEELVAQNEDTSRLRQFRPHATLPDLLAIPNEGFDLKGRLWDEKLFDKTVFNGTHTFHDAFVAAKNLHLPDRRFAINDLFGLIVNFFGSSGF